MVITYKGLEIEVPYSVVEVEDIQITRVVNDHCYLNIKLLIEEGKILEYINKDIQSEKITVKTQSDRKNIFVGKIEQVHMTYEGNLHIMEIKCASFTKIFDIKKNSRTFCNLDLTYLAVIQEILRNYDEAYFRDEITENTKIEDFLLQYEETDWNFFKRLATHFNTVLMPDCTSDCGRFYFGMPSINKERELTIEEYQGAKDIENYTVVEGLQVQDNYIEDFIRWEIETEYNLELGEQLIFNTVRCVVESIHTEVYKEELRTIYTLAPTGGIKTIFKNNHKIFGMSLPAIVKNVRGNTLSVHFDIDTNYTPVNNEKYFTYAIESSSFYCMPEKESKVHIYFPTNYETEAIAINSIRISNENSKYGSKTQNPDIKSFSHTAGSEMQLTPSDMSFAADDSKKVCLTLSQSGDVTLNGSNLTFTATEKLELGTRQGDGDIPPLRPETIIIEGKEKLQITKGDTLAIQMVEETFVQGPEIIFEGIEKDAVEIPAEIIVDPKKDLDAINNKNTEAKEIQKQKIQDAKSKFGFGAMALAIGVGALIAAATVLTGGLALVAIGAGAAAFAVGAAEMAEGSQDYTKAQSGDYSKSFNFMRDFVCQGNETLYNVIKYGSVLISSVMIMIATGGATKEVLIRTFKKMAFDMVEDAAFNALADYANDGMINNPPESYLNSMVTSGSMSLINSGLTSKIDKLKEAGIIKCATSRRMITSTDIGLGIMSDLATTGDPNLFTNIMNKYISNKICLGDPIDAATGSLYIPATDVVLPDIHQEFKIQRKYESLNQRIGLVGKGWLASFEASVNISNDIAKIICEDGHIETFNLVSGAWINDKGSANLYTLEENENSWLFISNVDKKKYYFDKQGKLQNIEDNHGNKCTITYLENQIETITTFSKYKLYFTYKDNKVIEIKDELGRVVQYKYNGDYLTEVVHVDRGITRYTYDDKGYISSITDQNGHTYTKNFFDRKGRVIRQEYPNGDIAKISYDFSEREMTFYYEQSERTERTKYNEAGLVTHVFMRMELQRNTAMINIKIKIILKIGMALKLIKSLMNMGIY
jgi:YD repeat-containing protein